MISSPSPSPSSSSSSSSSLTSPSSNALCYTTRSNLIEIIHRGIICCTELTCDGNEKIIYQRGDIDRLFYPRSAMKYVQILPLLESGAVEFYGFTEEEISIMCASHNSEEYHLKCVRNILTKIGLDEHHLQCGGHTPISEESAFAYVRQGISTPFRDHIYNNCSGKHAGFLALCKYLNHPLEGYLSPSHPIQLLIREAVCDVFGVSDQELYAGIDGCSAPAFALSARQAAYGFAKLCSVSSSASSSLSNSSLQLFSPLRQQAIRQMISAITHHPEMVYGANGFCTELMKEFSGQVIGKRGAAGVYLSGIVSQGIGIAVKMDDGTMGPQYNITMECLHWLYKQNKLQSPLVEEEGRIREGGEGKGRKENQQTENSSSHAKNKDLRVIFDKLERFRVTSTYNSMGVLVGSTRCVDDLFPSPSSPSSESVPESENTPSLTHEVTLLN